MSVLSLGQQQRQALQSVERFLDDPYEQVFKLSGVAGTGKTTLAEFISHLRNTVFCAYTGKAASVLRSKGCAGASTIHRAIYKPKDAGSGRVRFELNPEGSASKADLIVVDESSMVDQRMGRDLLSFGKKVLTLGDDYQLPPVRGTAFFDGRPDIRLTEVYRQELDNPIIRMATDIRERGLIPATEPWDKHQAFKEADIVLCLSNDTRNSLNQQIRRYRKIDSPIPVVGEQLVCLRNNHDTGLLNGTLWKVLGVKEQQGHPVLWMAVENDDGLIVEVRVPIDCFTKPDRVKINNLDPQLYDPFDFGYCLTVHKAQGSEWQNVCVIDQLNSWGFTWMARGIGIDEKTYKMRWLYTAVTRAMSRVSFMGG